MTYIIMQILSTGDINNAMFKYDTIQRVRYEWFGIYQISNLVFNLPKHTIRTSYRHGIQTCYWKLPCQEQLINKYSCL